MPDAMFAGQHRPPSSTQTPQDIGAEGFRPLDLARACLHRTGSAGAGLPSPA